MAERYGIKTIKDAIVTLLGTTNVSDLNDGLSKNVQQVVTKKPDDMVVELPLFPTVNVWFNDAEREFRGASDRKQVIGRYQIDFWTRDMGSVDAAKDQAELLADNILYILDNNTGIDNLGSTRGFINAVHVAFAYSTGDSGFIAHGVIDLNVARWLN